MRAALVVSGLLLISGCIRFAPLPGREADALHMREVAGEGDATRRASQRFVIEGLTADRDQRPALAQGHYERALQIDPTNPFAYLALARHYGDEREPERALEYLDQAETLLRSRGELPPRVEPHLLGLRGALLRDSGADGEPWLERARALAPEVWGDGHLAPDELR